MENITLDRLRQAGWTSERNINIDLIEKIFKEKSIDMPQKIRAFLRQYGMLEIRFKRKIQAIDIFEVIEFNPIKAIGNNLNGEYFKDIFDEYDINDIVYPIGISSRGNLLMLMTENGTFYRYTDGFLCKDGENIEEMFDCVIGECREPIYFE
ncbi:SUKH-3 immunity protein [Clostridium cavendishii DSM 21758]|uniref:SUKH-3 immunity protein n=1 Tax=Clostridium cavendishii DSM 21758 TaxID=1121302 RepID=A0A1M6JEZ4_9CLOT|nr:SUKH-3 domain-containing protein [Clostridium cavendishii]SHJ45215.1 SUKH-3 immunity protein [Clostridium cavendishii DSM 21758]